jgi:hypothetical protein
MKLKLQADPAREQFVRDQGERYEIEVSPELTCFRAWCDTRAYSVIVTRDRISHDDEIPEIRWHVSVAGEDGVPRWADFVAIVQEVRPGVMFCVPMPPRQFWLNVNPNVLHVWETKDELMTRQWREEGLHVRAGQRAGRFPGVPERS